MSTTPVTVRITRIKYYDHKTNSVQEIDIVGKMSVIECRKHIQSLDETNILISKENINDSFEVNVNSLYELKGA